MRNLFYFNKIYCINQSFSIFLFNSFFNYKNFIIDIYIPFWFILLPNKIIK